MKKIRFHNQILEPTGKSGKFWFVQNPRAASSSISAVLGITPKQHIPARVLRDHVGEEEWNNSFTFGIVRNPYDRIWSQYKNRWIADQNGERRWNLSFKQFVILTLREQAKPFYNNPWMFRPQVEWFCEVPNGQIVSKVYKKEALPWTWEGIVEHLNKHGVYHVNPELPQLNNTWAGHSPFAGQIWQHQYDDKEVKDLVEEWYNVDFKSFGYEKL